MNISAIIANARRVVHDTFSVAVTLITVAGQEQEVKVRWHNRIVLQGDLDNGGYADVIEGMTRLIFDRTELVEKGIVLKRGDKVRFPAEHWNSAVLNLDAQEPSRGPITMTWRVSK